MSALQACCWLPGVATTLAEMAGPAPSQASESGLPRSGGDALREAWTAVGPGPAAYWPPRVAAEWADANRRWRGATAAEIGHAVPRCRVEVSREGLAGLACARALGLIASALEHLLGVQPFEQQVAAAWHMLQGRLVEMATGEGKTLAAGLAAVASAWAGRPVHVLTANDYLVERDHALLAPVYALLGLSSATVVAAHPREARVRAYRQAIVHVTGRELVFDHLKDHLSGSSVQDERSRRALALQSDRGPVVEPLIPRLGQALVDEADSILLDEAVIPFVLSVPGPAPDLAALQVARTLAAALVPGVDCVLLPLLRRAQLTQAGRERVTRCLHPQGALWPPRLAHEQVCAALVARHLLHRERDYTVTPRGVELIDDVTGRIAVGRQWHGTLHAMVELEAGCVPGPVLTTAARLTYQRFFPRYEHLGGMSGTLREARGELRSLYGCKVVSIPRVRPSRARWEGQRCYVDEAQREQAVVEAVRRVLSQGRPVLVGTDSVRASQSLAQALARAGIDHQVLNAVQDADEADAVSRAGQRARVTVTTNMAGRGTDIRLDAAAADAGGLHVIVAQTNRSRRIDRQLAGRAARQGDPGSAEALTCLNDPVLRHGLPPALRRVLARMADAQGCLPAGAAWSARALAQRGAEWRERMLRRELGLADGRLDETFAFAGGTE